MAAELIDGNKLADEINNKVREDIVESKIQPGLAVIIIGEDKPSHLYVSLKEKASKKIGINFSKYAMDDDTPEATVIKAIQFLNDDPEIDAILVQLPLPKGFDEDKIVQAIDPLKDVDGFHPKTIEKFVKGEDDFVPGLSMGIIRLVEGATDLNGKNALIICNSDIFSQPLEKLLADKGAKVNIVKPDNSKLTDHSTQADIIIIAVGKPEMLKAEMIKEGAVIIDVGTTKVKGKLLGDVDYKNVKKKAGFITPVPGGVGPVTVAMLLENTLRLAKRNRSK